MKKQLFGKLFGVWLALGMESAAWAASDAPYPLTYADTIRVALANRGEIGIEHANVQRSEARVEEAQNAIQPTADAFSTLQRGKCYQDFSGLTASAKINNTEIPIDVRSATPQYQVMAGLKQSPNLYAGGATRARVDETPAANESRRVAGFHCRYHFALGLETARRGTGAPALSDHAAEVAAGRILLAFGLVREPEMLMAEAEMAGARARTQLAQAEYMPAVDVFARSTGVGPGNDDMGQATSDFGKEAGIIGVTVSWNLFDGFRASERVNQVRAIAEQSRLKAAQTRRELDHEQQARLSRVAERQDRLLIARKQLELSKARLKVAGTRWENQLVSALQYRAAELAVDEASSKTFSLEIDLLVSQVALYLAQPD